jgi:hypothetical protein
MQSSPLQLPFDKYYIATGPSIPAEGQDEILMNLSTNSLDYVLGLFLDTETQIGKPVNAATNFLDVAVPNGLSGTLAPEATAAAYPFYKSGYFKQGLPATNTLAWSRVNCNNVLFPSWNATKYDCFVQSAGNLGLLEQGVQSQSFLDSINQYQHFSFFHQVNFTFPNLDKNLRVVGGLSSLGNTCGIRWETQVDRTDAEVPGKEYRKIIVCKTTAVLSVGNFQQCSVMY